MDTNNFKQALAIVAVLVSSWLCAEFASGQLPTIQELTAGVDARHSAYGNLSFEYESRIRTRPSPDGYRVRPEDDTQGRFVRSRNIFKLRGIPNRADVGAIQAHWMRFERRIFGSDLLTNFQVTDEFHEYAFDRWNPRMLAAGGKNQGHILDRAHGNAARSDLFPHFLFLRPNGLTLWDIYPGLKWGEGVFDHRLSDLTLAKQFEVNGQTRYLFHSGRDPQQFSWFEVDMTGSPDFSIHRLEVFHEGKTAELYRVTEFAHVDGSTVPAKGFFERIGIGMIHQITYDFELTQVRHLTAEDVRTWIPSWPANTFIQDHKNGVLTFSTVFQSPIANSSPISKGLLWALSGCALAGSVIASLCFILRSSSFEARLLLYLLGVAVPTFLLATLVDNFFATLFAWTSLLALLLAVLLRSASGTTMQRMSFPTNDASTLAVSLDGERYSSEPAAAERQALDPVVQLTFRHTRFGYREWTISGLCLTLTVAIFANLQLALPNKAVAFSYAGVLVFLLSKLFRNTLRRQPSRALLHSLVPSILLSLLAMFPVVTLFEVSYFESDTWWCLIHIAAGVTVVAVGVVFRLRGWRVVTERSIAETLHRNRQFGIRELCLWVTAVAVLIAMAQVLGSPF